MFRRKFANKKFAFWPLLRIEMCDEGKNYLKMQLYNLMWMSKKKQYLKTEEKNIF